MELGERKKRILKAIIDEYIRTGEPVGSKTLVEMLENKVSSATIPQRDGGAFSGRVPRPAAYLSGPNPHRNGIPAVCG